VSLLRKALGDEQAPYLYIETIPRKGYRFKPRVSRLPESRARGSRAARFVAGLALVVAAALLLVLASNVRGRAERDAHSAAAGTLRPAHVNPEAYREYLQGNFELARGSAASLERAQTHFERAIEHDASYAAPHAGLALILAQLGSWNGSLAPAAVHVAARTAAQSAIDLDPSLADGYIALGRIRWLFDWDWAGAESAFTRGVRLDPRSSPARAAYANYLTSIGRFDEAIRVGRETASLDPLLALARQELGFAHHASGRDADALTLYQQALALDPNLKSAHVLSALVYIDRGTPDAALPDLQALAALVGQDGPPDRIGQLGYAYGRIGRQREALLILDALRARSAADYVPAAAIASLLLGLNRRDEALTELERACARHDTWLVWLKVHPMYRSIRNHPRFQQILRQMKFPA